MREKPKNSTFTDEQWKAIVTSGKSMIISAGAGSGKTAVLTTRIIDKIENGTSIKNLIVLTFTEAAAFEMKTRVRDALKKKVLENPSLKDELLALDEAMITTFDSFSLSLLKKYHYLFGIDPNIHIIDSIVLERKQREVMDEVFDEFYEKKDSSFYNFLDTFTLKDDEEVKEALLALSKKLNILYDKEKYYQNYINEFYSEEKINEFIKEYEKLIHIQKEEVLKNLEYIENKIHNPILLKWYEEYKYIKDIIECYTYDDYKSFVISHKLKNVTTSKKVSNEEKEEIKPFISKIKNAYSNIENLLSYESSKDMVNRYQNTKTTISLILEILQKYDQKLDDFKQSESMFEFSDVTRLSIKLLEKNKDILSEIKKNTEEIMIDEYQDTNDIGDFLISLIANNNIYMVGDIKQSIYGFRNANPKIFKDKYEKYSKGKEGIKIDLNKNFRSRREVLEGINFIFEKIMNLEVGGANYKEGHEMVFGNNLYETKGKTNQNYALEILDYPYEGSLYRKEEVEAFVIAKDIEKKIKNHSMVMDKNGNLREARYSDFCILMDRKTNFDLYKKIFTYLNIPLTIHKDESFILSDEIFAIKSILTLLLNRIDSSCSNEKHATISLARSFLFSYSDNDIFKVFRSDFKNKREVLKDLGEKLDKIEEELPILTLSSLLKKIYLVFDFYHKIHRLGNVEFVTLKLDYLLKLAKTLEDASYSLKDFVDYFDDALMYNIDVQFSMNTQTFNSVSLMTIHKSKGLEFPYLYVSGLYKNFSKEDIKSKYLYSNKYGIIVPDFDEGLCYPFTKDLFKEEHKLEDVSEKLRLFYVALTRAREKMILVCNLSENKKDYEVKDGEVSLLSKLTYTSFYDMLASIDSYLKCYKRQVNIDELGLTRAYESEESLEKLEGSLERLGIEEEINIEKKEIIESRYSMENTDHNQELMDIGTKIHEYLEYLDFNNIEEEFKKYEIDDFYQKKIRSFLSSDIWKQKILHLYKEYEFYFEEENELRHGIMDLLVETEKEFIVVDYKLKNINKEEYKNQINGYKEYLKSVTDKKVSGYLYSILDEKFLKV